MKCPLCLHDQNCLGVECTPQFAGKTLCRNWCVAPVLCHLLLCLLLVRFFLPGDPLTSDLDTTAAGIESLVNCRQDLTQTQLRFPTTPTNDTKSLLRPGHPEPKDSTSAPCRLRLRKLPEAGREGRVASERKIWGKDYPITVITSKVPGSGMRYSM